jgi:beta-galactosidase/beta-glucuronidase
VAIDAKGDGRFMADVFLNRAVPGSSVSVDIIDANGKTVGKSSALPITSDGAKVDFSVKGVQAWNAEQPYRYTAVFTLKDQQGKTLHVERQKFGFRTIEYRHSYGMRNEAGAHVYGCKEDGLFINGQKVIVFSQYTNTIDLLTPEQAIRYIG